MTTTHREYYLSTSGQDFYPDFPHLPSIDELLEGNTPLEEGLVFAHYFAPGYDFWLQAFDADTGVAFGKVRMTSAEFGTVNLKELCTMPDMEREVDTSSTFRAFMKPKQLTEFRSDTDSPANGSVHWF